MIVTLIITADFSKLLKTSNKKKNSKFLLQFRLPSKQIFGAFGVWRNVGLYFTCVTIEVDVMEKVVHEIRNANLNEVSVFL